MIKVFIGTLYSGEAELDDCIASIKSQTFKYIAHEVIKFLPNKEAHETLYRRFMEQQGSYDYFVKLDADMAFRDPTAIEKIVNFLEFDESLDHLVLSVHDFYTDTSIIGAHIFSKKCRWRQNKDKIFVDHNPSITGRREFFYSIDPARNMITHAFGQHDQDAVSFGVHKATKIIQNSSPSYNYLQLLNHWDNINLLIKRYENSRDNKCYLAISAFHTCIFMAISDELELNLENYKNLNTRELKSIGNINCFIQSGFYRNLTLYRLLGLTKILNMIVFKSVKSIKKITCKDNSLRKAPRTLLTNKE